MKKLTICLSLVIALYSCNQNPAIVSGKRDTSLTVINYANDWTKEDYRTLTALRVCYDTLVEKRDSSASQISITKTVKRDTMYLVRINVGKPDSLNGKPVLDSLGTPKIKAQVVWAKVYKSLVVADYK